MIRTAINKFLGNSLKARCARSSMILGVGVVTAKALAFVSKIILVRILLPQEMGLMVLILSLTAMFEVFTEVGIKLSVIQHKSGALPKYLNMAWWFQSIRVSILYGIAFLATPMVCRFYFADKVEILENHTYPELFLLVRIAFISIIFNGLFSPRAHVLEKNFQFGKSVLITQGSAIIGTALTIALTVIYRNVWAMVLGFCSMAIIRCLLSFIICPFLPKFEFDRYSFKELLRFAKGMFGIPVLAYIAMNIDVLVAGKLVATDLLGMYGMALALAQIPRELFGCIISPTLLPAFAEKQDDPSVLSLAVVKITKITALLGVPGVALAASCNDTILSYVYGGEYAVVAVPFAFLCGYTVILLQGITLTSVFFAVGLPEKHRLFVLVRVVILTALIYPALKYYGLSGAAISLVLANSVALGFQIMIVRKTIGLNLREYLLSYAPGAAIAALVILAIKLLSILKLSNELMSLTGGTVTLVMALSIYFWKIYGPGIKRT